jgi:hypothetical protein
MRLLGVFLMRFPMLLHAISFNIISLLYENLVRTMAKDYHSLEKCEYVNVSAKALIIARANMSLFSVWS